MPLVQTFALGALSCYYDDMQYLRYKPNGVWILDTTAPFPDRSGYANSATLTGSIVKGISLSHYALTSLVVNSTNYVTFPQNVYISGKETQPFSLAASVYVPDTATALTQQVLSNLGRTDGLAINDTQVTFSTAYTTQGSATCTYNFTLNQKLDIVGVHTAVKNYLFVNGELVDEIDITAAQQADTYATTNGSLYAGRSVAKNILVNSIAIFPQALSLDAITAMYDDNNTISTIDPYTAYAGELVDISSETRTPFLNTKWNDSATWSSASLKSIFVDDDGVLRPEMSGGLTQGGVWEDAVFLYNGATASIIDTGQLYWEGRNVTVQVSTNGTTWVTVDRFNELTSLQTYDPSTGAVLNIRVTFTAGVDEAYIKNLNLKAYLTNTFQQPSGRIINFNRPSVTFDDKVPAQLRDDWGTRTYLSALTINTDAASALPLVPKTIEIWMKQTTATAPAWSTNVTTGSTVYTNGVASSTTRQGEWVVRHYTNAAGISGAITVTANVQIGRVVLYGNALTAAQVATVYSNYTGVGVGNRSSGGSIAMTEHSPPANIYSHDWSTTS